MLKLIQRDPRWGEILLGFSKTTKIKDFGCTITCVGMLAGLNPDDVNERLKKINGYANTNLIIWSKIKEAIPWLEFEWRGYSYENTRVANAISKNGGCLVEVDGTPIGGSKHWVLYIGNQKLIDPWDGLEKPTSSYKAMGYSIINKIGEQPEGNMDYQKMYDDARKDRDNWWNAGVKIIKEILGNVSIGNDPNKAYFMPKRIDEAIAKYYKVVKERNEARSDRDNYAEDIKGLNNQISLLNKDKQAQAVQIKGLQDSISELEDCQSQVPTEEDLEKDYETTGRKIIKTIGDTTIETSYKKK